MSAEERYRRRYLDEFRRTSVDRIARASVLWIAFEKEPGARETAEELMRELHTLKGEARMMGFDGVGQVMHRLEELVMWAHQRAGTELPPELGDLVMDASDAAGKLLQQEVGAAGAEGVDLAALFERFDRFEGASGEGGGERGGGAAAPRRGGAQEAPDAWLRSDEDVLRVDVGAVAAFSEATFDLRVRARRLAGLVRQIRQAVGARRDLLVELERAEWRSVGRARAPGRSGERGDARRPLAELVGELLPLCAALAGEAAEAELLLGELDARARGLRLVPIATLFDRYVRVVRDLAREHGKEVTAKVRDAGVRLDKALIDRLAGPLAHLLRNAIDHGLEDAEERARAGKPRAGCIALSAEPRGGMVALTLADDGRGIDVEGVRARAVELGLVGEAEARGLEKSDILRLMFQPGVSTRRTVTQTSGRGIGLDAVKREIERLGGQVRVQAEAGQGTAVELLLPVSVALTSVLVIRSGAERYALPSAAISAVLSAFSGDLEHVHHQPALRVQDERLPYVELGALLGRPAPASDPIHAIVVGDEGRRLALAVSSWEDNQDVVVKPLGELLESARLFSGACLLEDGELALVLNPAVLMAQALGQDRSSAWQARGMAAGGAGAAARAKQRVLLAEDSSLTRSMLTGVLGDLGYQVMVARDGQEAMELLEKTGADLVLTDLDMPGVDGVELIRRIRGSVSWKKLPIIVLSTRGSDADKRRAAAAGADDYLLKSEFSEALLRDALGKGPPS